MNDGSEKRDHRRTALVGLRSDPEHCGCDIFTRRFRDIYSRRLQYPPQLRHRHMSRAPAASVLARTR
jgi:hypothetical protein